MIKINKNYKTIIQYSFLLFLIVITGYVVSTTLDIKLLPRIIEIVNKKYIFIGLVLILSYMILEVFVFEILLRSMENKKHKFLSFKLSTMGFYYNLVTPFASGAQPLQIYLLNKYDVSLSKASAIITNKTVLFQSIVTVYCGILTLLNLDLLRREISAISFLVLLGMIVNVVTIGVGALIIFNPEKVKKILRFILYKLRKVKIAKYLHNKSEKIEGFIDEYHITIKGFLVDKKSLAISIVLTVIQLTVYFSIAYCVYRAFNLNSLSYYTVLTLQVFLYMAVSPIPTPGNVGANELAFMTIFSNIFPESILGYAVFLYGMFVYYVIIIISGACTINTHYKVNQMNEEETIKNKKLKLKHTRIEV